MNDTEPSSVIDVDVDNRQDGVVVATDRLCDLLGCVLADQGIGPQAEVGLAFVDVAEMTELNRVHMGGSGPTDVLAFPIDGAVAAPPDQPALLGDIVVCPSVALESGESPADELALLVVHGALHLLGHDHAEPEESAVMKDLERTLLERYHVGR